ncbi:MAG: stage II sporulation protein M [Desulfobacteraceae bacterium]|jgi:uncharacterized membrane protein SpoIIM required for sporulation
MIIDLKKFVRSERPYWNELGDILSRFEQDPHRRMDFDEIKRLHYLYQRASADLAKLKTFSIEREICDYLEALVGRAYAMIHASRQKAARLSIWQWFWGTFPQTFRRHWQAFGLSLGIMLLGCLFGAAALIIDSEAKPVLMPFDHLMIDPAERVAEEEARAGKDHLEGSKTTFSAFLMTHNTRVSIFVLALGITWGIGTVLLLFANGVMLGAVAADYIAAGQSVFLSGWLLPHGVVEIPSILVAGQAGLILAGALIGRDSDRPFGERLRDAAPDVVTLIAGVALMLVWAGIVEAFFSQYHAPVLPYSIKIAFGLVELGLLCAFFSMSGRKAVKALSFNRIKSLLAMGRKRPMSAHRQSPGRE